MKKLDTPKYFAHIIIWLTFAFVIFVGWWVYTAQIDQIIRGVGRVVTSQKIQTIQNLEGGIISKIMVHEGSVVTKGMVIMELTNEDFKSNKKENQIKIEALKIKIKRLSAEARGKKFRATNKAGAKEEEALYRANQSLLLEKIKTVKKRLLQKESELRELKAKKRSLKRSLNLTQKEVDMKRELLAKLVGSRNELNLAEQKLNSVQQEYDATSLAIPRLLAGIEEIKSQIKQQKVAYRQKAQEELNIAKEELKRLLQLDISKTDRVRRAKITAPTSGVVKRLYFNTIGGVVRAGETIMEIVPSTKSLLVRAKISPKDIAFLYEGQEAIVRFSAYDFAQYGALRARVVNIGADTIFDEIDRKPYYQVELQTQKDYLNGIDKPLKIKVGMVATIDIIGKKERVLDYILSPIFKGSDIFSTYFYPIVSKEEASDVH